MNIEKYYALWSVSLSDTFISHSLFRSYVFIRTESQKKKFGYQQLTVLCPSRLLGPSSNTKAFAYLHAINFRCYYPYFQDASHWNCNNSILWGKNKKNKLVGTRMSSFCYTLCVSEYKYWQYSNTEVYQNNLKMFASKSDVYFIKWHARNTCTQISNHWIYASLTIGEASTLNEYRAENT